MLMRHLLTLTRGLDRLCAAPCLAAWLLTSLPTAWAADIRPAQACAGNDLVRVLDTQGTLWAWGGSNGNGHGQMGLGNDRELSFLAGRDSSGGAWHFSAQRVGTGYRRIACSDTRTAAIANDGTLWFWGEALADARQPSGSGIPSSPQAPSDIYRPRKLGNGFVSVALGGEHALAIRADGSLWAWGQNNYGQLGDGSDTFQAEPVKVGEGFAQVAAGHFHSAGIRKDGSLWLWGGNQRGQIGVGSMAALRSPPVQVPGEYQSVSLGIYYSAAVLANGDLMAWGQSNHGFGRGVEDDRSNRPQLIGTGFARVSVDDSHGLAITATGDVWEWGWRHRGTRQLLPVRVGSGMASISTGGGENTAIDRDGSLWVWGGSNWPLLAEDGYTPYLSKANGPEHLLDPTRILFPLTATRYQPTAKP